MKKLIYGIIGSGAIGAYYGARLAEGGKDVHFLFNSDYSHVSKRGLKVESYKGDMFLSEDEINAYFSTNAMPKCDVIIVALKTTSNYLLKELLPPVIHSGSLVVMIQNGINIEENLAEDFPDIIIAGGLAFIGSNKVAPGHIKHIDFGKISLAPYKSNAVELLKKVCDDFVNSGIETLYVDSLKEARWRKLLWNIPFNGLCTSLCTTTDKIMNCTSTRNLARDLMLEVMNAANAQNAGFTLTKEEIEELLITTDKMTPYLPSMRLDLDGKRPMEIEAIYSNTIELAKACGVDMPKTQMLRDILEFTQAGYLYSIDKK